MPRAGVPSDNGGAGTAADTGALTRSLSLKLINTAVCRPKSNGMAESLVNDYVARMDLRDARTVLAQLPAAFEHFNEMHPHPSLKSAFVWSAGGSAAGAD